MKNKNIKNKPKNVVDGFSCILDFPKFYGGGPPPPAPNKGTTSINPQNLSSTTTADKGKKRPEKLSPIKTIYKKFIFRLYRNWNQKTIGPVSLT